MTRRMTNQEIVASYSRIADKYAQLFYNELDLKPLDRKLYDLFSDKVKKDGKCVELGCGPGEVSVYLKSTGVKITGVDKSEKMIEIAKRLSPGIQYFQDDVFNLQIESNSYDGVVAPFLIVNFSDQEIRTSVKEMNRILKVNGILLLTFHVGKNRKLASNNFLIKENKIVFILHSIEKIKRIVESSGFKITEVVTKSPYEGEVTTRAFIYAIKK